MSNMMDFAKSELARIRSGEPDEMQDAIEKNVLDIVERFSDEGHSGSSAAYTVGIIEKLLRFEPLTPLTGDDDEWTEIREGCWQNKRCSHVFKDTERGAYDINGKVFVEPGGCAFTSRDSHVPVTFPYVPKTEYVKVEGSDG